MKTKYSMKSFPLAGWTRGDCVPLQCSSVLPLFSICCPFFFPPPRHTQKQFNQTAKLLISWKPLSGFKLQWSSLFWVHMRFLSKRAFVLSVTIFGAEMKARNLHAAPPSWGLRPTWESPSIMPVNHRHQSSWRERQRWPRTAQSCGVFMTDRVGWGAARKNKLQKTTGYLINHDNIVWLNEHFFPDPPIYVTSLSCSG